MTQTLLHVGDFAAAIGVTKRAVQKWLQLGRLPGCIRQRNGYYKIPASYVGQVQRGELPLAPANQRTQQPIPFRG